VLEPQAAVVRLAFSQYIETRSFSAVSSLLNERSLPAFAGGRWYPLTVRNMLSNPAYIGKTLFRRRRRVRSPGGKYRLESRPPAEHIEIPDVTPAIVDWQTWDMVQRILDDPERIARKPSGLAYELSSRLRCGLCSSAMVGQTLSSKGRSYRYYRCRHVYDKNSGRQCASRYIRADHLEGVVLSEVQRLLSHPSIVLEQLKHSGEDADQHAPRLDELERVLKEVDEREQRLLDLYLEGSFERALLDQRLFGIREQRRLIEDSIRAARPAPAVDFAALDERQLDDICARIGQWLEETSVHNRKKAYDALNLRVTATAMEVSIAGEIPAFASQLLVFHRTTPTSQAN
jgi:site-specific DNA recombinase